MINMTKTEFSDKFCKLATNHEDFSESITGVPPRTVWRRGSQLIGVYYATGQSYIIEKGREIQTSGEPFPGKIPYRV